MTIPTPAPTDPLDAAAAALEADTAVLEADIADLPKLDAPKPRRRNDTPSPEVEDGPAPTHAWHMPAQWSHPRGPWGDTPAQSRTN